MIKSMSQRFNKIAPELFYNEKGLSNVLVSALKYNGRARIMNRSNQIDLSSYIFNLAPVELDGIFISEVATFLEDKYNITVDDIVVNRNEDNKRVVLSVEIFYSFAEENIKMVIMNKYKESFPSDDFKDIY